MATRDKLYRLRVTFLDDGSENTFCLEKETDWGLVSEGLLIEVKDASGLKAYFPTHAVWMQIV